MRWVLVAAAYMIGCIPFGVIVARFYKVNLRDQGSGNIGATNALRVMGKKAGIITLFGDMLKGSAAVLLL
jgi:glycerol-3-phosphate acyltransferase PlsY